MAKPRNMIRTSPNFETALRAISKKFNKPMTQIQDDILFKTNAFVELEKVLAKVLK